MSVAQFVQAVIENVSGNKKEALAQEILFQCLEL